MLTFPMSSQLLGAQMGWLEHCRTRGIVGLHSNAETVISANVEASSVKSPGFADEMELPLPSKTICGLVLEEMSKIFSCLSHYCP